MKKFQCLLFRLEPYASLPMLFLLLCSPSGTHAQWEPDQRLTFNDSLSMTANNNAWNVAAGPGALVHVIWQDKRDGIWEIYYKRSSDGGLTWLPDSRLSHSEGFTRDPSISVLDSIVHVVWSNYLTDEPYEIYYKRSTDGGLSWSPDTRLTYDIYGSLAPSVCALGRNVYLAWRDDRYSSGEIYFKRSTNYGVSWDSLDTRLTFDPHSSWDPSIAVADSSVHIVWFDDRTGHWEIFYKRSSDCGVTWSADTALTEDAYWSAKSTLAVSGSTVHIVWQDSRVGDSKLFYKRSTDAGSTWSPDVRLTLPYAAVAPSLAASGSMVHVVWHDLRDGNAGEIYFKRSSDDGLSWSSDVRLTINSDTSKCPSVAVLGPIVHVVWYDHRDGNDEIYYKRNATGSGIKVPFTQQTINSPILFSFHPNPFTSFTALPGHEAESFALYDISGRKVGTYKGDRVGEGLSAGVYFLKPEGLNVKPLRIVKLR